MRLHPGCQNDMTKRQTCFFAFVFVKKRKIPPVGMIVAKNARLYSVPFLMGRAALLRGAPQFMG